MIYHVFKLLLAEIFFILLYYIKQLSENGTEIL